MIRSVVRKRLMDQPRIEAGEKQLEPHAADAARAGFVIARTRAPPSNGDRRHGVRGQETRSHRETRTPAELCSRVPARPAGRAVNLPPDYQPTHRHSDARARQAARLPRVHPLYGAFLIDHLGIASRDERIQLLESVLELPRPLLKFVRVPFDLPPGPLQTETLDPELIAPGPDHREAAEGRGRGRGGRRVVPWDERPPVLAESCGCSSTHVPRSAATSTRTAVWAAGELLALGGNFNTYVTTRDLTKQEGIIFRHLLRLILLREEFEQLTPPGVEPATWQAELKEIADRLTESCRAVDPTSTEETIKKAPRGRRGRGRGAREGGRCVQPRSRPADRGAGGRGRVRRGDMD